MHFFRRAFVTCYFLSFSYSIEGQEPPVEWPSITLEEVASIPGTITDIADAKDGSGRLFVVEKSGGIFIVKDGILLPETFLVVTNNLNMDGEYGLLGMAFAPDFKNSGEFYVSYVRRNGRKVVSRLKVGSTPDKADAASETELLSVLGYSTSIHAGGQIAFGPDGYLYIAMGRQDRACPRNNHPACWESF